ncbi:hypothetical protein BKA62DRAFT_687566 [Auriculariales sp. MPI-PUGE-AT-0066]|nr:hypothetical protein BKA62DRAFT_687566 [Auriculariales sp. MPI-PUGE-AT-0066]
MQSSTKLQDGLPTYINEKQPALNTSFSLRTACCALAVAATLAISFVFLPYGQLQISLISTKGLAPNRTNRLMPAPARSFDTGDLITCFDADTGDVGNVAVQAVSFSPTPLAAGNIYFFALPHPDGSQLPPRNPGSTISFRSSQSAKRPTVIVAVDINTHNDAVLPFDVCLFQRRGGAMGVGLIHTSAEGASKQWPSVQVIVDIPAPTSAHAVAEDTSLETALLGFTQIFNLTTPLETVNIDGVGSRISAESLFARSIQITGSAAISGTFNVTESLIIENVDASIDISVGMAYQARNHDEGDNASPVFVSLSTTHSILRGQMYLTTTDLTGQSPGVFDVTAKNADGALVIKFLDAPPGSTLHFHGQTSGAPSSVMLHPTYEGTFFGHTYGASAMCRASVYDSSYDVPDPAAKQRFHHLRWDKTSDAFYHGFVGEAWWGKTWDRNESSSQGEVHMINRYAPVTLFV